MGLPAPERCSSVVGPLFSQQAPAKPPGDGSYALVSNEELFSVLLGGLVTINANKVEAPGELVFPKARNYPGSAKE